MFEAGVNVVEAQATMEIADTKIPATKRSCIFSAPPLNQYSSLPSMGMADMDDQVDATLSTFLWMLSTNVSLSRNRTDFQSFDPMLCTALFNGTNSAS